MWVKPGAPSPEKKKPKQENVLQLSKIVGHWICGVGSVCATSDGGLVWPAGVTVVVHDWKKDSHVALIRHRKVVSCVAAHPTQGNVIACGEAGTLSKVTVWDIATHTPLLTIRKHKKSVSSIAFSTDGNVLITCGGGDEVLIWNWKSSFAQPINEHRLQTRFSSITPMASLGFLTSGSAGHLKTWPYNPKDKDKMPKFNLKSFSTANFIAVGCAGPLTYAIAESSPIVELDKKGSASKWVYGLTGVDRQQGTTLTAAAVTADIIAVGSSDGKVNIFGTTSLAYLNKIPPRHSTPVLALVPDRNYFHIVNSDKSTFHYELVTEGKTMTPTFLASRTLHGTAIWGLEHVVTADGGVKLASCSEDGRVQLWTLAGDDGSRVRGLNIIEKSDAPEHAQLRSLSVNRSGDLIAVGDKCGVIRLVSVGKDSLSVAKSCEAHDGDVLCLSFGPPSAPHLLASGGRDGLIHLLSVDQNESGCSIRVVQSYNFHTDAITSVLLRPEADGTLLLVSSSTDGNLSFQNITPEGDLLHGNVVMTQSPILGTDLHPRGTLLLCVGNTDFLSFRLMTTPLGQARRQYSIPSDGIGHHMVTIDPSGTWIAVGGCNGSVKVVDYCTGTIVAHTPATGAQPTKMVWITHSSGRSLQLLIGDAEGCLSVWKLSLTAANKALELANPPQPAVKRVLKDSSAAKSDIVKTVEILDAPQSMVSDDSPEKRDALFTSGVLKGAGVEGKWHNAAYQAFVHEKLDFPQFDAKSSVASTCYGHHDLPDVDANMDMAPFSDDDEPEDTVGGEGVPLSKRSICATKDIQSLWGSHNKTLLSSASPMRSSLSSRWRQVNDAQLPTDPHPSVKPCFSDPFAEEPSRSNGRRTSQPVQEKGDVVVPTEPAPKKELTPQQQELQPQQAQDSAAVLAAAEEKEKISREAESRAATLEAERSEFLKTESRGRAVLLGDWVAETEDMQQATDSERAAVEARVQKRRFDEFRRQRSEKEAAEESARRQCINGEPSDRQDIFAEFLKGKKAVEIAVASQRAVTPEASIDGDNEELSKSAVKQKLYEERESYKRNKSLQDASTRSAEVTSPVPIKHQRVCNFCSYSQVTRNW
ncbi:hypothetical protein DIPPA_00386 [Diplonema papillatum]|nr:hypothetical protein DIPPA_00386 [Diplonema papillatum]